MGIHFYSLFSVSDTFVVDCKAKTIRHYLFIYFKSSTNLQYIRKTSSKKLCDSQERQLCEEFYKISMASDL